MRVAVRGADSSEVVRVSEVSPETSFRELDDAFLQTQTRIWLGEVLHMRFDEETPVAELLADGELLYQVSKVVWKMLLNMHADLKDSKLFINQRTSYSKSNGKKYLPYCRVDSFLKICQILGLTGIDLFSPSDAVGKRDIRRVCMCIRSFSKKARSRNLNVPDFEMVIYTIAMPTDIVGGIRRTLEQSSCSSSNSDSCSDLAKSSKQNDYSGYHDQSHNYFSESDGAESCCKELEFETPANDSFHGASIFDLDPEDFTQEYLGDDNLPQLHSSLEQKDQREREQHNRSTSLESISSTCRSITETNISDIVDSGTNCCKSLFSSDAKSSYRPEAQIREKENQSHNHSAMENYFSVCSSSGSPVSAVANDEILETSVDGSDEKLGSTDEKHDNLAFECWILHEEKGNDGPLSIAQSHNATPICENSVPDEDDENISLVLSDNFEGVHGNSVGNNSMTTAASSVDGYALPDYSDKDKEFNFDCSSQKSDDAERGILEVQGSVVSVPVRDEDSQGQGSKCPDMNAVDQVIFLNHKRFSAPDPELFPDNASAMLSDGKLQSSDDIVSALAICSYETDDVNVSSVSDDSFDKDIKKGTQKESDIGCFLVVSTIETNECTLPGESVGASQTTISEGQDSRMFDGSYPKDTSTCGQSVAEKGQLIGMIMQEKRDLFSRVPDGALAVSSEENGKIGSHLIHKTDPNLTDASVELKSQNNLDTESNQYDMAELDNTTSYDDTAGLKFSDGTAREKTLKCLIECGNTLDSFVECSSYSPELITTDVHSMFLLNVDGSCRSTCSEETSEQVLPLEEQNAEHSHASHTQPESSQGMMNDFGESGYISEQRPCKRIKNSRIGSDGAKLTKNPKLHCHDHTFAPQEFNDDRIRGNPILPCSNSEILEEKNDISTEKFSEVKNQVHLINEAVIITDHAAPNDTDERLKGIEVLEENAPTTPSEKSNVRSTRRKMITSIASSVTVIGALLVFLRMRGKKYIEQNPQTVVPQPAKRTSEKVYTQNKVENTGKPGRMYPGERFKF